MKKIIALSLLLLTFVGTGSAQYRDNIDRGHVIQDRRHRQEVYRNDRRHNRRYDRNQTYIRNEYRYVRIGRRVYRETYRTTYSRTGRVIFRVLTDRDLVNDRDRNRSGFKFNIYIPF